MEADAQSPLRELIPAYDMVFTYGGGQPVIDRYLALGARSCTPVYNGLDPETHHPEPPRPELACNLAFLGNRLPDREARIEEFFFRAVEALPERTFLLGGNGWEDRVAGLANLRYLGHVPPGDHNALNRSALAVLNVSRESMAANGWSPATRVFEAAGAGACLITDDWEGIEDFLAPGEEALVARDGAAVAELLAGHTERIKTLITDQPTIAGIGNAYSDEILHTAKLSPYAVAGRLKPEQIDDLHAAMTGVLGDAVARSVGQGAAMLKGEKRSGLRVHARTGLPCPVCGDTVREVSFADRSFQYCPGCQTGGRPLADRRLSRLVR